MNYNQDQMHELTVPKNPIVAKKVPTRNGNQRYTCGVILYAHINKCAGGTVVDWFRKHAQVFYVGRAVHRNQLRKNKQKEPTWRLFGNIQYKPEWGKMIAQVDTFLANVSSKTGWRVLHVHHFSPGLSLIQSYIEKWEKAVEAKGCIFYKTTVLRDPLDRFISNVNFDNVSLSNIDGFMESRRNWLMRYLLFGICGIEDRYLRCGYIRNGNFSNTPNLNETLMDEVYDLTNGLDLVGFTDTLDSYFEEIGQTTGWITKMNNVDVKKIHKSRSTFNLTRSLISKFIALNQHDYMFYYTMRKKLVNISRNNI